MGQLELVTAELATSMLVHAPGGRIVITHPQKQSIEVIAVEAGPSLADLELPFQNGSATRSTPRPVLSTVREHSQRVSVFRSAGQRLVISVLIQVPGVVSLPETAVISIPIEGESVCGDSWAHAEVCGRLLFLIADGLGHGVHAAEASQMATRIFNDSIRESPDEIVRRMHKPMKATHGAAVMIVSLEREKEVARWCGIGNIASTL